MHVTPVDSLRRSLVSPARCSPPCGDDNADPVLDTSPTLPAVTAAPPTTSPDKPTVSLPAETPTELVITDLIEGTGPAAQVGDTVTVNYVGVRSEDGTEFDNSYDRGAALPGRARRQQRHRRDGSRA